MMMTLKGRHCVIQLCFLSIGFLGTGAFAQAQTAEVRQLLLNVEKLEQLREMLEGMKEKYRILESGFNQVKGITEGNFRLHEAFLNRLKQVSPEVKSYYKVAEIVHYQLRLIQAVSRIRAELNELGWDNWEEQEKVIQSFTAFSRAGMENMETLLLILADGQLQLDDGERIRSIDRIHDSMQELLTGLSRWNWSYRELLDLRKGKQADLTRLENRVSNG
ncbi:TerB family tellurite resistance protein [Algoriphagus sp.]|uniref:TerB family tellurite resistance protein n=1 Tax=Algoriphagus sp. TaxID=1872435 RepID=UPI002604D237|nr:TerB family tellurite resistance protein [Algoriphagus sp.]